MTRLPLATSKEMEKILYYLGFERIRQAGSHVLYRHPDGRTTVIPFHSGEDLGRGLIRKILHDIKMEAADYLELRLRVL